jgi:hypothetical protein
LPSGWAIGRGFRRFFGDPADPNQLPSFSKQTLATLLITRQFVQNFTEIGVPLVLGRLRMLQLAFVGNRAARRRASSWQVGDEEQELVDGSAACGRSSAERQAALSEYGRPVDDYLEIFVQLGVFHVQNSKHWHFVKTLTTFS